MGSPGLYVRMVSAASGRYFLLGQLRLLACRTCCSAHCHSGPGRSAHKLWDIAPASASLAFSVAKHKLHLALPISGSMRRDSLSLYEHCSRPSAQEDAGHNVLTSKFPSSPAWGPLSPRVLFSSRAFRGLAAWLVAHPLPPVPNPTFVLFSLLFQLPVVQKVGSVCGSLYLLRFYILVLIFSCGP